MHATLVRCLAVASITAGTSLSTLIAPAASDAVPAASATIRVAHFSPDTPGVDIYLTSFAGGTTRLWLPDATYGGVSPYGSVSPGLYVVSIRLHGTPASSKPAVSWNLDLRAGQVYTTAAVGVNKSLKTIVLHDDLTPPPAGKSRIRVVQGASRAPRADVIGSGAAIANNLAFASSTSYSIIGAGSLSLRAQARGLPNVTAAAQLPLRGGTVNSVLVLDSPGGGITLKSVLDAAGSSVMPVGAVPAGGGGTARLLAQHAWPRGWPSVGLIGAVLGGLAGLMYRGHRSSTARRDTKVLRSR
jgi:hypothetical protein